MIPPMPPRKEELEAESLAQDMRYKRELRDYFAAAALRACPLLFEMEPMGTGRCGEWVKNGRGLTARCYAIADAMLAERERS